MQNIIVWDEHLSSCNVCKEATDKACNEFTWNKQIWESLACNIGNQYMLTSPPGIDTVKSISSLNENNEKITISVTRTQKYKSSNAK